VQIDAEARSKALSDRASGSRRPTSILLTAASETPAALASPRWVIPLRSRRLRKGIAEPGERHDGTLCRKGRERQAKLDAKVQSALKRGLAEDFQQAIATHFFDPRLEVASQRRGNLAEGRAKCRAEISDRGRR
jgi:hypothetical protein